MKNIYLLLLVCLLFSCEKNEITEIYPDNLLIGFWANPLYDNGVVTFERVSSLPDNARGFHFKEDSCSVERTSGWCGTPPLTFFNVEGNWELDKDILDIYDKNITLVVGAEPVLLYHYRIISLTENELVVVRELTEKEEDHQALMDLFEEISTLSINVSCIDTNDWSFTPYGAKACGGPQGFIPYSNQIDVANFLRKVEAYTEAENQYNIKWGIISTCDLPAQPTGIECQNGYPMLIY